MPANRLGYAHDVFISYEHNALVPEWLRTVFVQLFQARLAMELAARYDSVDIFWDHRLIPGQQYQVALSHAVHNSCCMIGLWSASYFSSEWCVAEWQAFAARGAWGAGNTAVVPVRIQDGNHYPGEAKAIQAMDFSPYLYLGEAFLRSEGYLLFQRDLKELAGAVASIIKGSPAPSPQWPLLNPPAAPVSPLPAIPRVLLGAAA